MIQDGAHLTRCIFYIDMNMVRAGECKHPSEWAESGYNELTGKRRRYRIISIGRVLKCLGHKGEVDGFRKWYARTLEEYIRSNYHVRESIWTESLAIGEKKWLQKLGRGIHGLELKPIAMTSFRTGEKNALYSLSGSSRVKEAFWGKHQK
jgi:putative transposase